MPPLVLRILADIVLVLHLGFVLFVVLGGLAGSRWPNVACVHIPAMLWGVIVELGGWICPLTPLENCLRTEGGGAGYSGDFVDRVILPLIYPQGLTRHTQIWLGLGIILFNGVVYAVILRRRFGRKSPS